MVFVQRELGAVVDATYSAILDDAAFANLPRAIARYVGSESGWFLIHEAGQTSALAADGIPTDLLGQYEGYFGSVDPYTHAAPICPPLVAMAYERLVPTAEYERTEFYADYVQANRMARHVMGMLIPVEGALVAASFHRTAGGAFGSDLEQRLQPLAEPLRRLLETRRAIARQSTGARLAVDLLEDNPDAILLCDPAGRVMHRNRSARRLPVECCRITRDGVLGLSDRTTEASFHDALEQVARHRTLRRLHVARRGKLPFRIDLAPAPASGGVVVTIVDLERRLVDRVEAARRDYGFTPSECALAESLMRGRTPDAHAALRGTSIATVRTQLRSMLDKAGVGRQPELVALIGR